MKQENTLSTDTFNDWMSESKELCVELCGKNPDKITKEMWTYYFLQGISTEDAASIVAKSIS